MGKGTKTKMVGGGGEKESSSVTKWEVGIH